MSTWLQALDWQTPHSIHELTAKRGARRVIPDEYGFYAFVEGKRLPHPDNCLYIGIAARQSLYKRLGAYLRKSVVETKAERIKHSGKRRLSYARMRGTEGHGAATTNTLSNDNFIHVCWSVSPLIHDGSLSQNSIEAAYLLERAIIDYYRPVYNTADWEGDLEFDLEDEMA